LSPFAARSDAHSSCAGRNRLKIHQTSSLSTASGGNRRRECCAKFAQLLRNKFNAIKNHSTRLNFGRLYRWNHPPNHIEDKRKEAAKSKN
jgi:hypothetical protein